MNSCLDRAAKCRLRKLKFLETLRECGNVRFSAKIVGVSKSWLYACRQGDVNFAREWDIALTLAAQKLYKSSIRRGCRDIRKKLYYGGTLLRGEKHYSNQMVGDFVNFHLSMRKQRSKRKVDLEKIEKLLIKIIQSK